jgi:hypothetical protein
MMDISEVKQFLGPPLHWPPSSTPSPESPSSSSSSIRHPPAGT